MSDFGVRVPGTGLRTIICYGGEHAPRYYNIVAKVFDGKTYVRYTFSPHYPIEKVLKRIPRCYDDKKFLPRRKVKGITTGELVEVKREKKLEGAIMLDDGTIIIKNNK